MSDRVILKSTLAATPECLAPGQLEAFLDGKASHPHLAQCPRCQGELALLKSFESAAPLPDEGAAVAWISSHLDRQLDSIKNPKGWASRAGVQASGADDSWLSRLLRLRGWGLAIPVTALAGAAIVAAIFMQSVKEPELQATVDHQPAIYRSQEVQAVGPAGEVPVVPKQLQWQAFAGTQTYKVVLMEVDNSPLWSAETKAISVEIPAPIRAKIAPGKPILWQVTAVDLQGQVLGTSQVQRFSTPRQHSSEKDQLSQ